MGTQARAAVALASLALLASCVLADPAPTLPLVAQLPPLIDLASVYPPAGPGAVIATWPDHFTIPVFETDPSQPLAYLAYYGYSSLPGVPGNTPQNHSLPRSFPPNVDAGLTRSVTFTLPENASACQTVLIVVANSFDGYIPVSPDYASVSWLYVPSGNATDCNIYDAGYLFDATFPDAAKPDATLTDGGS